MPDAALLDELALNATASTTLQYVDGWALRASPSLPFRRSNCAMALRGAGPPPWNDLEVFYWERNLPIRAQVSTAMPDVDNEFAARGYAIDAPVDVMVAGTASVLAGNTPADDVTTSLSSIHSDDSFAQTYGQLHDDERVLAYGRMMRMIGPEARVVVAHIDGEPVGMVFGVIERGWCGVYGLTTVPHARGRGVASTVMHALAAVASASGARNTYLQMERENDAARALYEKTGFTVAYGYHYRVNGA